MNRFEALDGTPQMKFAASGPLLMACSHAREDDLTYRRLHAHLRDLASDHANIGLVFIVGHETGPPDDFARQTAAILDDLGSGICTVTGAILTQGFMGAVYRSVGTVLLSMTRRRGLVSVHQDIHQASEEALERLTATGAIALPALLDAVAAGVSLVPAGRFDLSAAP
ncbi:MAG: hypothetical protein AB8I08_22250 [Sandaracinaceae bacterium]